MARGLAVALGVLVVCSGARSGAGPADDAVDSTVTLRIATIAPRGSIWAREFLAFADEIARGTHGRVKLKLVFGGAAGSEHEVGERIARGQLDGTVSGGVTCRDVAPSMRVTGLLGTFQSREEARFVMAELRPTLEKEAHEAGFVLLGTAGIGSDIVFSRTPIRTMAQLRAAKLWRWDLADVELTMSREMGMVPVALPLDAATKAYDDGRTEGFYAVPQAALAFQWYAQVKYVTNLRMGYLVGCLLVTDRAFDRISDADQKIVREASQKTTVRIEDLGQRQDDEMVGGVFGKQGLEIVPVSDQFRAEFFDAARLARAKLGEKLVPKALVDHVSQLLADYRAEHAAHGK